MVDSTEQLLRYPLDVSLTLAPGEEIALPPARFALPRAAGRPLGDHWLVFELLDGSPPADGGARGRRVMFVHSDRRIFAAYGVSGSGQTAVAQR